MRAWTKSACVVFAWSIVSVLLVAAVVAFGRAPEVQAGTRTPHSSTQLSGSSAQVSAGSVQVSAGRARVSAGSSSDQVVLLSALSVAAAPVALVSHPVRYVVQAGDSLAGIAARLGVAGGWPVLYAANRRAVGGDPDVIRPGLVLVVPGAVVPARYVVAAGDSLAGIAARLGVAGGWRALYAANRHRIGGDPNVISAGLVLAIPRPATAVSPGRTRPPHRPAPRAVPPVRPGPAQHPVPAVSPRGSRPRGTAGMPGWLKTTLLAAGLLILVAFVTEPLLLARRRRQHQVPAAAAAQPGTSGSPGGPSGAGAARRIGACQPARHPAGPVTAEFPAAGSRTAGSPAAGSRTAGPAAGFAGTDAGAGAGRDGAHASRRSAAGGGPDRADRAGRS